VALRRRDPKRVGGVEAAEQERIEAEKNRSAHRRRKLKQATAAGEPESHAWMLPIHDHEGQMASGRLRFQEPLKTAGLADMIPNGISSPEGS
jgi:hypothetical protein